MERDTRNLMNIIGRAYPKWSDPTNNMYAPYIGAVDDKDTVQSIITKIYEAGVRYGHRNGMKQKQEEIKMALGIFEEDNNDE